jgi:hypothetical protein
MVGIRNMCASRTSRVARSSLPFLAHSHSASIGSSILRWEGRGRGRQPATPGAGVRPDSYAGDGRGGNCPALEAGNCFGQPAAAGSVRASKERQGGSRRCPPCKPLAAPHLPLGSSPCMFAMYLKFGSASLAPGLSEISSPHRSRPPALLPKLVAGRRRRWQLFQPEQLANGKGCLVPQEHPHPYILLRSFGE